MKLINDTFTELLDFYTVETALGEGLTGDVWKVSSKAGVGEFAAKVVDLTTDQREARLQEAENEISMLEKFSGHPHIVRLHQVIRTPTYLAMIVELCKRGSLYDCWKEQGSLSEDFTRHVMRQVLDVVQHLHHNNVVHRDIKMENVLLDNDVNIKVIDFCFANTATEQGLTGVHGSLLYLAPEVLKLNLEEDAPPYGKEVDTWACGVLMYTLLGGRFPFEHRQQRKLTQVIRSGRFDFFSASWNGISDHAKDLISRLLTRQPVERITASAALEHPFFLST